MKPVILFVILLMAYMTDATIVRFLQGLLPPIVPFAGGFRGGLLPGGGGLLRPFGSFTFGPLGGLGAHRRMDDAASETLKYVDNIHNIKKVRK